MKKKKAFKGSQHTSDAIGQKIDVVENICLLRIALKDLLQTDATDFKKPGHSPGRSLVISMKICMK